MIADVLTKAVARHVYLELLKPADGYAASGVVVSTAALGVRDAASVPGCPPKLSSSRAMCGLAWGKNLLSAHRGVSGVPPGGGVHSHSADWSALFPF